jgi:hypothetical protein
MALSETVSTSPRTIVPKADLYYMDLDDDTKNALREIHANLDSVLAMDVDQLTQRRELGVINFTKAIPHIYRALDLAGEYRQFDIEKLMPDQIYAIRDQTGKLHRILENLSKFSIKEPDDNKDTQTPSQRRDELLQAANNQCGAFLKALLPDYGYLKMNSEKFQSLLQSVSQAGQQTSEEFGQIKKQLEAELSGASSARVEAESILSAMKEAAGKTGASQHSTNFSEIADKHKKVSWAWLAVTCALITTVAGYSWYFMSHLLPDASLTGTAAIQRIVAKLVFLSALYFALLAVSRNYRAHRHLAVLNEHRATALKTFETFVKGASDDQTKNAVLLEATRCVFASAASGYLSGEDDNPQNRIIEVLKLVNSGGKS